MAVMRLAAAALPRVGLKLLHEDGSSKVCPVKAPCASIQLHASNSDIVSVLLSQCLTTCPRVYCRDQNYSGSGKCFQEIISEKLLIFLRDGSCLN